MYMIWDRGCLACLAATSHQSEISKEEEAPAERESPGENDGTKARPGLEQVAAQAEYLPSRV